MKNTSTKKSATRTVSHHCHAHHTSWYIYRSSHLDSMNIYISNMHWHNTVYTARQHHTILPAQHVTRRAQHHSHSLTQHTQIYDIQTRHSHISTHTTGVHRLVALTSRHTLPYYYACQCHQPRTHCHSH
jgi:hypothetical protein